MARHERVLTRKVSDKNRATARPNAELRVDNFLILSGIAYPSLLQYQTSRSDTSDNYRSNGTSCQEAFERLRCPLRFAGGGSESGRRNLWCCPLNTGLHGDPPIKILCETTIYRSARVGVDRFRFRG